MMIDYTGQQVGNYRLLRRLGIGGFASVYQGQHIRIATQQAAIKILHMSDIDTQKFQQEAETTAALVHPNIIRLFDFDRFNDISFLVIDYAPGGSLRTRHPQGTQLPLSTVIEYIKVLAGALQFAHDKNIIHRDIKPENILIGTHEELRLSDFGIAVLSLTGRTTMNPSYGSGGTPYYMAPEQCRGKPEKAGDQYALAIIAYEWLCGNPPFSEGNAINIQFQHTYEPVPPLCKQLPTLPEAVERVILTALAKDPKQRYQSVQIFADALDSASKKPVASIPVFAEALEQAAKKPATGTTLLTYEHNGGSAVMIAWSPDGKRLASGGADGTVRIWEATSGKTPLVLRGHSEEIWAVAWSLDGRLLASGSDDKTVQVWDATSGKQLRTYKGHSDRVTSVVWSPDERLLASGSDDKTVQVWEAISGRRLFNYKGHSNNVNAVAWSPDGCLLASGSWDNTVQVWETSSGRLLLRYKGHSGYVNTVAWSPDGHLLASGGFDYKVQVWEAISGWLLLDYEGHSSYVNAVAWSPDGRLLASSSDDKTVQVWEIASGKTLFTYCGHFTSVYSVAWSSDGDHIASTASDVKIWQAP